MKKSLFLAIFACMSVFGTVRAEVSVYAVHTRNTSLVVEAENGGKLLILHYGSLLSAADIENLAAAGSCRVEAYPAFGMSAPSESALAVTHSDGNLTTDLRVENIEQYSENGIELLKINLKDTVYPLRVAICYNGYENEDIIETWSEIRNDEKRPVTLTRFYSGVVPLRRGDVWISHLHGAWANEARLVEEPLSAGAKVIRNRDGVRNSQTSHAEAMFSLDGKPSEQTGRVIGAALCYGGNYELSVETDETDYHRFFAGIDAVNSAYKLAPKETFVTPVLALTFSGEGLGGASRNFHRWGRNYKLAHGDKPRKILLNSWEGVYFGINEEQMEQMMSDIASMGGELFVMDDGWFGEKYPRRRDNTALGDWNVDREKLPGGVSALVEKAKGYGIDFGIWIEPEMANTVSELYDAHPDWIVKAPEREPVTGRGGTQVVLDLSNPKVQDFVVSVVDKIMTENPEIDYIKWDANMSVLQYGSQYLTADNQSRLYIDYHRGFAAVCDRIRAKYPDLTIQACASGGGRVNYGILPWFDEFWTSDNTDALQRIYIQWGTSYFFPAIGMASHISASPNHQTGRVVPLKYRIDVAMSGRLGMEIQPADMTDREKALCRKAIAEYKDIRPVVQFGDIYRLVSPYDGQGVASLMYCSPEKDKAVFYWWKLEYFYNQHFPRVRMAGLNPDAQYKIRELNVIDRTPLPFEGKIFSGRYLMKNGLEIPVGHNTDWRGQNEWASRVLYLEAQ